REWAKTEAQRQDDRFDTLRRKRADVASLPSFDENASTEAILEKVDARAVHLEKLDIDLREWEKQMAKAGETQLRSRAAAIAKELEAIHAARDFLVEKVSDADGYLLKAIDVSLNKI